LRSIGRRQRRHFELRMILKQLNETLADNTSRSENAYAKFPGHTKKFTTEDTEESTIEETASYNRHKTHKRGKRKSSTRHAVLCLCAFSWLILIFLCVLCG
jgi:hypothetical protein